MTQQNIAVKNTNIMILLLLVANIIFATVCFVSMIVPVFLGGCIGKSFRKIFRHLYYCLYSCYVGEVTFL